MNSPAALVLGPRKVSLPPLMLNGENNGNVYQNVYALPNGQFAPCSDPPPKGIHSSSPPPHSPNKPISPRYFKVPSPAFDRNPAYQFRKSVTSPIQSWNSSLEDITPKKGDSEVRRRQVS